MLPTIAVSFLLASRALAFPRSLQSRQSGDHAASVWDNWQAPRDGDVRGPCPVLNSLANHGLLTGTGITKAMLIDALDQLSMDEDVATGLYNAVEQNGLTNSNGSFDLDSLSKHNAIEHDGSLSRADAITGDDHSFNQTIFDTYLAQYPDDTVDAGESGKAREFRIQTSKKENPHFTYGLKQQFTSIAETGAFMSVLGGPSDPQVPISWIKVLFEEERFPYNEGWRPSTERIGFLSFMKLVLKIAIDSGTTFEDIGALNLAGLINAFKDVPQLHWPKLSLFGN